MNDDYKSHISSVKNSRKRLDNLLKEIESIKVGDIVVHNKHGIARFDGLQTVTVIKQSYEMACLVFHNNDKLYVSIEDLDEIKRYGTNENVTLDKLYGSSWEKLKKKIREKIKIAAETLIKTAAERSLNKAPSLIPNEEKYNNFCAEFPYTETNDQLNAIEDVQNDLAKETPMDRLICGDVGFGKTEVAMRAAFTALSHDATAQVAVIAPTTILCRQHYKSFCDRFKNFPFKIKQLSRLVPAKEATHTKALLTDGKINIIIGTHALLSKNISFKNLALLIVDEEQHFGVKQKETLKDIKSNVHILTLSATPIPRTLQMSMSGIRDLSIIATPPTNRLPIITKIMTYDGDTIRQAIMRERERDGKVFFVCPHIKDLSDIERNLSFAVPDLKKTTVHGQMTPSNIERIMQEFIDGKIDILITTTIIESGLDIPYANTIIIYNSHRFGLSQLYQLRGRVGRHKNQAYAYFLVPEKKLEDENSIERLKILQSLNELGAGFSIASHDMDMRGFGNLAGSEQAGQVKDIGVEMYQTMLKDAVEALKSEKEAEEPWNPEIKTDIDASIPEKYISDENLRLSIYRRASDLVNIEEIENFMHEIEGRFGKIPDEFIHFMGIKRLRTVCKRCGIGQLFIKECKISFKIRSNYMHKHAIFVQFVLQNAEKYYIKNEEIVGVVQKFSSPAHALKAAEKIIEECSAIYT